MVPAIKVLNVHLIWGATSGLGKARPLPSPQVWHQACRHGIKAHFQVHQRARPGASSCIPSLSDQHVGWCPIPAPHLKSLTLFTCSKFSFTLTSTFLHDCSMRFLPCSLPQQLQNLLLTSLKSGFCRSLQASTALISISCYPWVTAVSVFEASGLRFPLLFPHR